MNAHAATEPRRLGRAQVKMLLRLAVMGGVGIAGIIAVSFLSRAMADITRSEETAAIFNVSAELHHDLVEAVEWRADPPGLPKELAPLDREAITETWLRAWTQFLVLSDGSGPVGSGADGTVTDGLIEYFGGAAEDAMLASHSDWLGLPIHQIGHDLQLNFYSDDGSVVSVSSEASRFLRGHPVDGRTEWYDTVETYDAVFVFREGNWRVHHWVRRSSEGSWATQVDNLEVRPLEATNVRSITWAPTNQTPEDFWANPDLAQAEREIAIIDDLGFNTVRFEVPFDLLGGRDVTTSALFPAAALMDIADENGLNVIVSLLGNRTEHQPLHWDADDDHLLTVMDTLGDHPALILWELGSEPDTHIGIERVGPEMLDAWLTHVGRTVRDGDRDTPITIGWSSPRAAAEAPPIADVVSFTWSGDMAELDSTIPYLRDIADGRPLLVADASYHTHVGVMPGAQTEAEQARFYADMLIAVEDYGLQGFNVSSLRDYDVDNVAAWAQAEAERLDAEEKARVAEQELRFPPPVTPEPKEAGPEVHEAPIVAEVTWPIGAEAATGLVRVDGSPKPAAAVFAPGADLDAVPSPSLVETITKPFNLILFLLAASAIGGWVFLALWARGIIRFPKLGVFARIRSTIEAIPVVRTVLIPFAAVAKMAQRVPILRGLFPQNPGASADGNDAQQRQRRPRKKVSVTAPIEQQPMTTPAVVSAPSPSVPAEADAPKEGMFRRVVTWLNAPVLPEDTEGAVTEAPVVEANPAETTEAGMAEATSPHHGVVAQPVVAQPIVTEPAAAQPVVAQPAAAQPVVTQPQPIVAAVAPTPVAAPAPVADASMPTTHQPDQLAALQQAQFAAWLASQQAQQQAIHVDQAAAPHTPTGPSPETPAPQAQAPQAPPTPDLSATAAEPVATPSPPAGDPNAGAPTSIPAMADPATGDQPMNDLSSAAETAAPPWAPAEDEEDAAPTSSLADALPSWPNEDMLYSDVHNALFGGEPTSPPPATAMSMTEVDLQSIDSILDSLDASTLEGPMRYAPFLMRALCIAARTINPDGVMMHVDVAGPTAGLRRINDVQDKRLSALTRDLVGDGDAADTAATAVVHISNSIGGHLRIEIGDGTVPTVSLVHLHKRPIATRDRLGCTAITTHTMGLLSVAASSTPIRADEYLQMLREILETRDWTTELD